VIAYALQLIAGTAFICVIVYLIRMGCRAIVELSKLPDELNCDQKREYTCLPPEAKTQVRDCPQWMKGARK